MFSKLYVTVSKYIQSYNCFFILRKNTYTGIE